MSTVHFPLLVIKKYHYNEEATKPYNSMYASAFLM